MRNLAAVALVVGLMAGTVWWQTDDTWPLAQMRMFPGGSESNVAILAIKGELADGRLITLAPSVFHMKRADIEGQLDRASADPRMLRDLMDHYNLSASSGRRIESLIFIRRERISRTDGGRWAERELVRWPS
jgi:hypothetical protein